LVQIQIRICKKLQLRIWKAKNYESGESGTLLRERPAHRRTVKVSKNRLISKRRNGCNYNLIHLYRRVKEHTPSFQPTRTASFSIPQDYFF
jgi:hypothetical protein